MGLLILALNCAQIAGGAESDFGLKSNTLTNWLFRAETDLLTSFSLSVFFCA